jgi:hypothetical protein
MNGRLLLEVFRLEYLAHDALETTSIIIGGTCWQVIERGGAARVAVAGTGLGLSDDAKVGAKISGKGPHLVQTGSACRLTAILAGRDSIRFYHNGKNLTNEKA